MIVRATNYYRIGDIDSWFYEWKNIKFQIIAELSQKERESLATQEKYIMLLLNKKQSKKACHHIEKYLTEIQDYIKKKEIGLAEKSNETVFT